MCRQRDVAVAGGDQAGRNVGVGRCHQLHVQAGAREGADLLGHQQRRVVRVHEPVQQHCQMLGRRGWGAEQSRREEYGDDAQCGCFLGGGTPGGLPLSRPSPE